MSGSWTGGPQPGVGKVSAAVTSLKNGIEAALSCFYGPDDPQQGGWGAPQVGYRWIRTSSPFSELNPGVFRWEKLSASPSYGWRFIGGAIWIRHDTPAGRDVAFSPASPATANVAWTDLAFASQIDDERTAQGLSVDKVAFAVVLEVKAKEAGTIPSGAGEEDKSYIGFRRKGDTGVGSRLLAQVSGRTTGAQILVLLDAAEKAQFEVKVADTNPSLAYSAKLTAWLELA